LPERVKVISKAFRNGDTAKSRRRVNRIEAENTYACACAMAQIEKLSVLNNREVAGG